MAWLDELKHVATGSRWASKISWSDVRADSLTRRVLLDFSAKEVALRDGEIESAVWQATYAKSTRAQRQRAHNKLRRASDARHRRQFHRSLVEAIAVRVKEIRGRWPSYSGSSFGSGQGGKDVIRISDWLRYIFCPRHSDSSISSETIVKSLKGLRRHQRRSSRDILLAKIYLSEAYQLLRMAEADFAAVQRATGAKSEELRTIRAVKRRLSPYLRKAGNLGLADSSP